jgi:hypothetical protein
MSFASTLGRTGGLAGTPRYMAPEQWSGGVVDEKSDQFSFCVALYEAIYRAPPFAGVTPPELANSVRAGALAEPPRGVAPRWLGRVLARGLSVAPASRFATMRALLAALEPRRSRGLVAATLLVALVAIVAAAAMRARPSRARACTGPPSPTCRADEFCSFLSSNSCGAAGEPGSCVPRPIASECGHEQRPVCGCDGVTYPNTCMAWASGTGWDYSGPCRTCRTDAAGDCRGSQYCSFPETDPCGVPTASGICRQRPHECKVTGDPVCGCDGKSYRSLCAAHAVGINVKHAGDCF